MSAPHAVSISTHVLDTARGAPAAGIEVTLERVGKDGGASLVGGGRTDVDGRIPAMLGTSPGDASGVSDAGTVFRLRFATGAYLAASGRAAFYPEITIAFRADPADARQHYHVPLLLNPFGYTTYRGS